ncbi:MAG: shikimate dehydrogenase [Smithellaceae bacterium]
MICIPITAMSNKEALRDIDRSCLLADALELRMDLIADGSLPELIGAARRSSNNVQIIVTYRKKEEAAQDLKSLDIGTDTEDQKDKKMAMLKQAIELGADYIDIELSEGSAAIEAIKAHCERMGGTTGIIVSYHNFIMTPSVVRLKKIFHQCREFNPAVVKIVTFAGGPEDNLKVLGLIPYARKQRQNIIALCMGDAGRISRIMASYLGNFLSFAALEREAQSAPGQFTVSEIRQINKLIGADEPKQKIPIPSEQGREPRNYILLGNPIGQSLSPLMHNAALNDLEIEGRYNAFCVYDLAAAVQGIRGMDIHGASVTIPFKSAVMEYLDDISGDALKIGAVNTIVNDDGRLKGFNTDWIGLMTSLGEAMCVGGKKFVILGAGGTARAAAYGIIREGGFPVIVNRAPENGRLLAKDFGCPFYPLSEIGKIEADCMINTTPVGMYPHIDESPVDAKVLAGYKYVMDVIYNPHKTKLLQDAEKQGCHVLPGLDMFVHQGAEQVKLWTGREPNRDLMKKVVLERLTKVE